jgi:hypothetical protein
MNPFTRFLNQWSQNRQLDDFIAHWDGLEGVVVGVYREKMTPAEAEAEFQRVWSWLRHNYGQWERELRPYWQQTKAAGEPVQTDPFRLLLAIEAPHTILGNSEAIQHLPAAREALNRFILDRSGT